MGTHRFIEFPFIAIILLTAAGAAEGESDCCYQNGSPGCSDGPCQSIVCLADPFCCTVTWDILCAGAAETACADLCEPGGSCPGALTRHPPGWNARQPAGS